MLAEPQLVSRGYYQPLTHPLVGEVPVSRLADVVLGGRAPAPPLGRAHPGPGQRRGPRRPPRPHRGRAGRPSASRRSSASPSDDRSCGQITRAMTGDPPLVDLAADGPGAARRPVGRGGGRGRRAEPAGQCGVRPASWPTRRRRSRTAWSAESLAYADAPGRTRVRRAGWTSGAGHARHPSAEPVRLERVGRPPHDHPAPARVPQRRRRGDAGRPGRGLRAWSPPTRR